MSSTSNVKVNNRSGRACLNCRRHKMKCENDGSSPCKRCSTMGKSCVYARRLNASIGIDQAEWADQVDARLYDLEGQLRKWKQLTIMLQKRTLQPGEQYSLDDDDIEDGEEMDDEEPDPPAASRTTGKKRRLTNNLLAESQNMVHEESPRRRLVWDHESDSNSFDILIQLGKVLKRLTSASRLDRHTDAWSMHVIRDLWSSFEQDILPWLNLGVQAIESSMLGSLLVTGALVSSAQSSKEHRRFLPDYRKAFEHALSEAVRPWEDTNTGQDSESFADLDSSQGMEASGVQRSIEDAALSDVLGILFVCLPLVGRNKRLSSYLRCAYGMILDSIGSITSSQEDRWRLIWDRLNALDQIHRTLHLVAPILPGNPPSKIGSPRAAISFPSAWDDLAKINDVGHKHFAGSRYASIASRVWTDTGEKEQITISDMAVLDNWLGQLRACAKRYQVEEDLRYLLNRLIVQSIGANAEQSIFGSEDMVTARKALQEHARLNKGAQTEYELIVLTHASVLILTEDKTGSANHADLQPVIQFQTYLLELEGVPYLRHLAADLRTRIHNCIQKNSTILVASKSPHIYGTLPISTTSAHNQDSVQMASQQSFPYLGWQTTEHGYDWMPETQDRAHHTHTAATQIFSPPIIPSNGNESGNNRKGSTPSTAAMNDGVMPIAMDAQQLLNYSQQPMRDTGTGETWPPAFIGWLDQSGINAVHNYFDHM